MKNRWILYLACLAAACDVCPRLVAQFQQPTQAELKMTADPQAPDAEAVYLNLIETADNPGHFETFHARIKVLAEKGKDAATVRIPYDRYSVKISKIKGRTIQPDGTVIPMTAKPADLESIKAKGIQVNTIVFTLPSVEVGSILEYSYQTTYEGNIIYAPSWEIQRNYPILKAHYELITAETNEPLIAWSVLPRGVVLNYEKHGKVELDLTDVPAVPHEDWMPPIKSVLYKVIFYFAVKPSLDTYWKPEIASWQAAVDEFAKPTNEIRAAVNGLVAPGGSDRTKARKLYNAVQQLENTDFTRAKDKEERKKLKEKQIKRAEDVWTDRGGNSSAIALLYLSMLRAAGIKAYAMRVVDRDRGEFAPGYFDFDQLDDTVVLLTLDGKEVVADPGEKMCPFLTLKWTHAMAEGVRENDANGGFGTTSMAPFTDNKLVRDAKIDLDATGKATGEMTFTMVGQDALRWRQYAVLNDLTEVKKQFTNWAEKMVPKGMDVNIEKISGLDDEYVPLSATLQIHGMLGSPLGQRLLMPGEFFDTRGHRPFVGEKKRREPVDMHYGEEIGDRAVYTLPAGMSVEGAPKDTTFTWPGHAELVAKMVSSPGKVTLYRTLARGFTLVAAADYADLLAFYQKVAANDHDEIVLKAGRPQKGN